jgi:hypothetical protein
MNGSELHAELHVTAFTLADLRAEQEAHLARLAAMRARLEGALLQSRAHVVQRVRFIEDVSGTVLVRED